MNNTPNEQDCEETPVSPKKTFGRQKPQFIKASLNVTESSKSIESAKADLEVEDPKDEKVIAVLLEGK